MKLLKFSQKIDRINEVIAKVISLLTILMVLITFAIATMRYVFNIGFIYIQESVIYLHAMVFLISSAYALNKGHHVKIDILYNRLSPRRKIVLNSLGTVFLLFPSVIVIFILSLPYVLNSWKYLEASKEAGGLDLVYLLKTNLIVMPILLFFQGISEVIKNYSQLKKLK